MSVGKTVTGTLGCTSAPRMKLKAATETVQELYKQSLAHRHIPLAAVYSELLTGDSVSDSPDAVWKRSACEELQTCPQPQLAHLHWPWANPHSFPNSRKSGLPWEQCRKQSEWLFVQALGAGRMEHCRRGLKGFPPQAEAIQLFQSRCCRSHHVRATECVWKHSLAHRHIIYWWPHDQVPGWGQRFCGRDVSQ